MGTKGQTIESARSAAKRSPKNRYAIYRVGAAWMYTSKSLAETQAAYKVRVNDYEVVATGAEYVENEPVEQFGTRVVMDNRITKADVIDFVQLQIEEGNLDFDAVRRYFDKYWPQ